MHSHPNTVIAHANRHRSAQTARYTHTHTLSIQAEAEPPNAFTVHGLWSLSVCLLEVSGRGVPGGGSRGSRTARKVGKKVEEFLGAESHITEPS